MQHRKYREYRQGRMLSHRHLGFTWKNLIWSSFLWECLLFYIKNYFKLSSYPFQKVFFSPNDLKCLFKRDPLNQGQKRTLTTLKEHHYQTPQIKSKEKTKSAFRYLLYNLQRGSDQNKINVFWLDNQQQWLPMRYW